jgi:hypothetical protein
MPIETLGRHLSEHFADVVGVVHDGGGRAGRIVVASGDPWITPGG